jgi:predicted AlkP superfamily pyrophosphatase or phosphodiesterase
VHQLAIISMDGMGFNFSSSFNEFLTLTSILPSNQVTLLT